MKKLYLALLLLLTPFGAAYAQQQQINCAPSTPCNASTGPSLTNTGDPLWKLAGKVNANEAQLYSMFGVSGVLKGNGAVPNALTQATAADLIGLWSGTPGANICVGSQGALIACGSSLASTANQTVIGNGSGTTAVPVALTLSGNLVATPSGLTTSQSINAQVGTSYVIVASDAGKLLTFNNAASTAVTLAQAGTTGFFGGFSVDLQNRGAGGITLTPTTSTINGGTTLTLAQNTGCTITSDGTNYQLSACTAIAPSGGGGGSSAFSALTGGTNTTAAMVLGSGATLVASGSGTIVATSVASLAGLPSIATQTVLGNGTGSTGPPAALTLSGNLIATATGLGTTQAINSQTGTSYAVVAGDAGKLLTLNNASAVAVSLSQANQSGFTSGFALDLQNKGAGVVTLTPATSTINGASTLTIAQNRGCTVTSDGTNYQISSCSALVTTSGSGTVTSAGLSLPAGWTVSNSPVTTSGTLTGAFSGLIVGGTKFTLAPTGCTPSATSGGATAGTITLAAGPCTSIVVTMNGATGLTAPVGWNCAVHDRGATTIPTWGESASSTTTATIPVPGAVGATDVLSFSCTGF